MGYHPCNRSTGERERVLLTLRGHAGVYSPLLKQKSRDREARLHRENSTCNKTHADEGPSDACGAPVADLFAIPAYIALYIKVYAQIKVVVNFF